MPRSHQMQFLHQIHIQWFVFNARQIFCLTSVRKFIRLVTTWSIDCVYTLMMLRDEVYLF